MCEDACVRTCQPDYIWSEKLKDFSIADVVGKTWSVILFELVTLTNRGQFKKIHEDESLPNEDKFQYLLQVVVSNSKAARVVESFPATAENYPKAIAQLQERFEREDLLVQIYVRDLLSMVRRNAATERSKTDLPALYDELEAKIRALESLVRTQDKYGEFLSPMVESCLPEDILLEFERSKNFKEDTPGEGRSLNLLMNFLK
ncbi:integrase catalytic domain-containing protein [Trichonephila clavipes]|nr:integrase catalytic domain-containing protein [Trichonephila clavipes]